MPSSGRWPPSPCSRAYWRCKTDSEKLHRVHTRAPTGERAERLVELSALVERLTRIMDPSSIAVWLRKPVPALDDDKPLEVIGRGDYRRVAKLLSALEESPTT